MARSLEELELAFKDQQVKKAEVEVDAIRQIDNTKAKDIFLSKLKSNKDKILMIACFLIGMTIFIYPPLSDYIARRNVVAGANTYERNTSSLSGDEKNRLLTKAKDYNDSLSNEKVEDPFVPGSGRAISANYNKVLNTEDGIMGYVDIPTLSIYLPIRHGSSEETLTKGAGHIEQTHLPIGGEGNLSVITAHTGFAGADMFNRLVEMEIGDTFMIYILDQTTTYQVDDIAVIDPEDIEKLLPVEGKDYATLVTCTPYGVNSHRLLVRGERIPNVEEAITAAKAIPFPWRLVVMIGISVFIFVAIWVWNYHRDNKRRKDMELPSGKACDVN